jgi:signal transduction histidine kinase
MKPNDSMSDVYTAVVHDVKNHLAELALRLGQHKDLQQETRIAMNAARRLSDLLLLQRQSQDLLCVNSDHENAVDFLSILAAEYRELFPNILIEINTEKAPAFAFFDDALVRMALANVLHNACRFARETVTIAVYEQDGMLVFEIADDGPGFSQDILADGGIAPTAVSGKGTGLGIYLARKIAELHNLEGRCGKIELCNADGAVFRMSLP